MKTIIRNIKTIARRAAILCSIAVLTAIPVHAASDPVTSLNNLSTLIGSIISAAGTIVLMWGAVQLGLSIKRHDPASASEGILGIAAGLIIAFAPWIVTQITG